MSAFSIQTVHRKSYCVKYLKCCTKCLLLGHILLRVQGYIQGHACVCVCVCVCVDLDERKSLRVSAPVKTKYKSCNIAFGSAVYIFLAHTVDGHRVTCAV